MSGWVNNLKFELHNVSLYDITFVYLRIPKHYHTLEKLHAIKRSFSVNVRNILLTVLNKSLDTQKTIYSVGQNNTTR